jgi:hypothetical protein
MVVSISNCPRFLTACGCVDGVSFYGLLRSETEFRQHLPVVLPIREIVYWENNGEVLPKLCLGSE